LHLSCLCFSFFFSSRRRHTRFSRDWSSDVCSSDLKWDLPVIDPISFQSTRPDVFFGGDAALGPKNIITAVAHGHQAAISIHLYCSGQNVLDRPAPTVNLYQQKMGIHEWIYDSVVTEDDRHK